MNQLAKIFVFFSLLASPLTVSFASDAAKKMPELTKEERLEKAELMDKMAETHKKFAECLRSDKPLSECHDQMRKDCPMAKNGSCPMMEEWHGMKGMHHRMHGKKAEPEKED